MTKTCLIAALFMLTTGGIANAGGQEGSVGVGAEYQLSGLGGGSVNYDAGIFHAGGFFGFYDGKGKNNTVFELGGRFYYHLHSTAMADFGLGGGIGIASVPDPMMPADNLTLIYIEPGFQIRLFLASNVALSVAAGMVIGTGDADEDGVAITGQSLGGITRNGGSGVGFNGGAGIHYYFF